MGIECASKSKDKEWQELESESTGGFQMYTHRNRQTTSQGLEDTDKTNQLLIWSFQCRWNEEWRGDQSGISRNWNQWLQGIVGSSYNRLK